MKKILFVDDEPSVLRGLERMLSDLEDEFQVAFAESGQRALDLLAAEPFDVVVSDMRMPGMDGAQLLREVRRRHPEVVRIVLSGHSSGALSLRSLGAAHQYLAKPCDHRRLRNVVLRACALRELLAEGPLRLLVSQARSIPSLPRLYAEFLAVVQDPEASIREVAEVVARDVGMSAKILQIVNSAFFGLPRDVSDVQQAVSLLGFEGIRALVLTSQVFSKLDEGAVHDLRLGGLWNHSLVVGALSKLIASDQSQDPQVRDHAMMAGLLHDAGKIVLAVGFPDRYRAMLGLVDERKMPLLEAERQVFGSTHGEVGAYLFGLWGLPDAVVEAVAFHHFPDRCLATSFTPLTAVHVADFLEHEPGESSWGGQSSRLDIGYLERLEVADRLPIWREVCQAEVPAGVPR